MTSRRRSATTSAISSTSSTPHRSRRRPTTGSIRSRRWTPTSTACATCSTTARSSRTVAAPVARLPVLVEQRDLRRPAPDCDPDARGLSRPRVVHRPARLLRRGEALRRDAVRELRPAARRAGADGAAVQQLRAGPQDHRRARAARLRPRRARTAATSSMLSDGSATRTFCYVRRCGHRLLQGAGPRAATASPTISAPRRPRSRCASWPSGWSTTAAELFGYTGKVVLQAERATPDYLVDNPNRRCPVITKARDQLGYDPQIAFDEGLRRCGLHLVLGATITGRRTDA